MGNHDSHHPIRITNKSGKRIKVRVDVNKMELKCSYVGTTFDRHSKSIDHNDNEELCLEKYAIFKILEGNENFVIMCYHNHYHHDDCHLDDTKDNHLHFSLPKDNCYHGYLTVLQEDDKGLWSVLCENHSIPKESRILINHNVLLRQTYLPNEKEYIFGRIVVSNQRASKRLIWVNIDYEQKELEYVVPDSSQKIRLASKHVYPSSNVIKYRFGTFYNATCIQNHDHHHNYSIFYLPIDPDLNLNLSQEKRLKQDSINHFFLSICFEDEKGDVAAKCESIKCDYRNQTIVESPNDILIPHVYVEDEDKDIRVEIRLEKPSYHHDKWFHHEF